jgi:hypothetical protein
MKMLFVAELPAGLTCKRVHVRIPLQARGAAYFQHPVDRLPIGVGRREHALNAGYEARPIRLSSPQCARITCGVTRRPSVLAAVFPKIGKGWICARNVIQNLKLGCAPFNSYSIRKWLRIFSIIQYRIPMVYAQIPA